MTVVAVVPKANSPKHRISPLPLWQAGFENSRDAPVSAVGLLRGKRRVPLPRAGVRGAPLHPGRAAGGGVASDRERGADPGDLAAALACPLPGRPGDPPARRADGLRPGRHERQLLHRHRPPAARHRGGDRVPPGYRARRARDADSRGTPPRSASRPAASTRSPTCTWAARRSASRPRLRERRALRLATSSSPTASPEAPASPGIDGLAGAMLAAAVAIMPAAPAAAHALTDPALLAAGIGVGVTSSVIPYICDQLAMARLPRADLRASGLAPPGHGDGDRHRRPRSDPHGGRGRRRRARDRRRGASPRALNGRSRSDDNRGDARQEDLARRGPAAGDRRRRPPSCTSRTARLRARTRSSPSPTSRIELNALQSAPFHASAKTGGSRVLARREMDTEMDSDQPRARGTAEARRRRRRRSSASAARSARTTPRSRRSTAAAPGATGTAPQPTGSRPQAGRSAARVMRLLASREPRLRRPRQPTPRPR